MIKVMEVRTNPDRTKAKRKAEDLRMLGLLAASFGSIEILREIFLSHAEQNMFLFAGAVVLTIWGFRKLWRYK